MGLTQPIFPGLSRIKDAQRNFFHEQIAVPGSVADLFTNVTETIEERAAGDKKRLAEEVRKLASNGFLKALSAHGDVAFYKAQLDRLGIGNGALELVLRASSTKELHVLIEQLVMHALVAAMRRSGSEGMAALAKSLGAQVPVQKDSGLKDILTRSVAVGVPFCIGLLTIAFVLLWLGAPVNYLLSREPSVTLWPSTVEKSENGVAGHSVIHRPDCVSADHWYLVSWARGTASRRSLIMAALLGIIGIGFVAVLYDLAFLDVYLSIYPKFGPSWEHVVSRQRSGHAVRVRFGHDLLQDASGRAAEHDFGRRRLNPGRGRALLTAEVFGPRGEAAQRSQSC